MLEWLIPCYRHWRNISMWTVTKWAIMGRCIEEESRSPTVGLRLHKHWPLICTVHNKEMQFMRAEYKSCGKVGVSGAPPSAYAPYRGWIGVCFDCYGYEECTRDRKGSVIGVWVESP